MTDAQKSTLSSILGNLRDIITRIPIRKVENEHQVKVGNTDDRNCCIISPYMYGTTPPTEVFKGPSNNPVGVEGQIYFYIDINDPNNSDN